MARNTSVSDSYRSRRCIGNDPATYACPLLTTSRGTIRRAPLRTFKCVSVNGKSPVSSSNTSTSAWAPGASVPICRFPPQDFRRNSRGLEDGLFQAHPDAQHLRHHLRQRDGKRLGRAVPVEIGAERIRIKMVLEGPARRLPGEAAAAMADVEEDAAIPGLERLRNDRFVNHAVASSVKTVGQNIARAQAPQDFRFLGAAADVHHERHGRFAGSGKRHVQRGEPVIRRHGFPSAVSRRPLAPDVSRSTAAVSCGRAYRRSISSSA